MPLSGDRNLASQGQPIKPGLFVLTTNSNSISWTKAIHPACGNVGLADGSVQFCDSRLLVEAVQSQGGDQSYCDSLSADRAFGGGVPT